MNKEDIYNDMLKEFPCTLKETSKDKEHKVYMTECKENVVHLDKLVDDFVKKLLLSDEHKSCDTLYMTNEKEFFMIEFKNGEIKNIRKSELKMKILESLLILSEKFSQTINFMRDNMNFILVYNQDTISYKEKIKVHLENKAQTLESYFEIEPFKKLYLKDVFVYSKRQFESEFVSKYIRI